MTETVKKTTARKPKTETTSKTETAAKTKKAAAKTNGKLDNLSVMPSPAPSIAAPSYDQIAALAHRYWAERGYKHGSDAQDWFRAEQELRAKAS